MAHVDFPRAAKRACDPCRYRKIKCEATAPTCANCHKAQRVCHYSSPRKRGPKSARPDEQNGLLESDSELSRVGHRKEPSLGSPVNHTPASDTSSLVQASFAETPPWLRPSSREDIASCGYSAHLPPDASHHALQLHQELVETLRASLPSEPIKEVVDSCVSFYMQYVFPTVMVCHEPSLRASAVVLFGEECQLAGRRIFANDDPLQCVELMRQFTILTGLCASVAFTVPETFVPSKDVIAGPFLSASRRMLKIYEDHDLEYPNSSSLIIRQFHSTAIQQSTGKAGVAWHVLGQAGLLAQKLRIFDEDSLKKYDKLESQLLRYNFWQLYSCDKTAEALDCRPITLHECLFKSGLTVALHTDSRVTLLDLNRNNNRDPFEENIFNGFHLLCRVWPLAAGLIEAMRNHARGIPPPDTESASLERLTGAYMEFTTISDDLPSWMRINSIPDLPIEGVDRYQNECYLVQRSQLFFTFHCAKLAILRNAIQFKVTDTIGLNDHPHTLALRQIEVANDFVEALERTPFRILQVEGESGVERIRHVGGSLLEVDHNSDNTTVKSRARSCLSRLLDILVRLDSRASDALGT